MDLSVRRIRDEGVLARERVVIDVLADADLGGYILAKGQKVGMHEISDAIQHLLWFPDVEVEEGDLVVIYTRKGVKASVPNNRGSTTHRFYLDQTTTLWRHAKSVAVLLELADWDFDRER